MNIVEKELISVIVPVYNVEKYLEKCIMSLVNQTYQNIEIILVDDGSTDKSSVICDAYALKYENIYSFHKSNGGLSDARNFGIGKAKGKYIGFVDSDDYVDERFYEILFNDIYNYNADISCVGLRMVDSNYEKSDKISSKDYVIEKMSPEEAIPHLFNNEKYCNYAWNKLYKKDLFDDILFPVGKKMEDLATTYKLFHKATTITYNSIPVYFYFQRENSILHDIKKGFYEDKLELSKIRYDDIVSWYPDMKENKLYFLNVIFECIGYLDNNHNLKKEINKSLKQFDKNVLKELTLGRKVKYIVLTFWPKLYFVLCRKKYEN